MDAGCSWRMRVALAKDGSLLSEVLRACMRKVFAYQRRKARAWSVGSAKTLAVAYVQRFGSLLQLNPHTHMAIHDAVWSERARGELEQHELEAPSGEEVEAARVVSKGRRAHPSTATRYAGGAQGDRLGRPRSLRGNLSNALGMRLRANGVGIPTACRRRS